jgi:hypothetical protein
MVSPTLWVRRRGSSAVGAGGPNAPARSVSGCSLVLHPVADCRHLGRKAEHSSAWRTPGDRK